MHDRDPTKFQHQGFGTLLMEEAERIAREEHGSVKLSVISGVGVRHYYAKLGYHLDAEDTQSSSSLITKKSDSEMMHDLLNREQSTKASDQNVVKQPTLSSRELSQALFDIPKKKRDEQAFDHAVVRLVDSFKEKAAEQERVYAKVSREAKALKKNLEHVQREREDDQKKKEIEISLRRVGAIRYRALGSRLDGLNEQMNALKCVLNSLEGFVQQVEKAKDPDEALRSICISDIEKNKIKSTKLTGFKKQLWHLLKHHSQGMHQELQSVAQNHAVIQQNVSDLVCFLAGMKTTLASQQGLFNAMAVHVKDLLGTIEACMISAANTSKLIQDVKLSAQSHKSSLKHLLNRHGIYTYVMKELQKHNEVKKACFALLVYNLTNENAFQEQNRLDHSADKEEWPKEQEQLVSRINSLTMMSQRRGKEESPKDDQQRLLQDCMNSQIIGQDTNKRKIVGTDHRRITRSAARKQSTESPGPAASTSKMLENTQSKKTAVTSLQERGWPPEVKIDQIKVNTKGDPQQKNSLPKKRRKIRVRFKPVSKWCTHALI
ncbi:hypothetical protein G6F21_008635 [Rhizopus arrhizus]|nr:hypothetical protein G6F21_008635 [Rhizopus arrhizus]